MESWPETLPADVLIDGYAETLPDTTVRTQMDAGPAKVRRRYTAGVEELRVRIPLTRTQVATFRTWWSTDLEDGALPFSWTHPRTGSEVTARFRTDEPPELRPESGVAWILEAAIEVLP